MHNGHDAPAWVCVRNPPHGIDDPRLECVGRFGAWDDIPTFVLEDFLEEGIALCRFHSNFATFPLAEEYLAEFGFNDGHKTEFCCEWCCSLVRPLERRDIDRIDRFSARSCESLSNFCRLEVTLWMQRRIAMAIDKREWFVGFCWRRLAVAHQQDGGGFGCWREAILAVLRVRVTHMPHDIQIVSSFMAPIVLTSEQARVLGSLMEKAVTTPEQYPLSLNSLRLACNQTTNREPVVSYDERIVQVALEGLREMELATRNKAPGERSIKYRHRAPEVLELDRGEAALLCVLLLRGDQTPGELKQRSDRMHSFATPGDVERTLVTLSDRGMVQMLPRRPGQKESRWIHLLGVVAAVTAQYVESDAAPTSVRNDMRREASGPVEQAQLHASAPQVAAVAPKTMTVVNPTNGGVIRAVEISDDSAIAAKLRRARAAQSSWATRPYLERAENVLSWRDEIIAHGEECGHTTSAEMGSTVASLRSELVAATGRMTDFVEIIERLIRVENVVDDLDYEERVAYEARGVVGCIGGVYSPYATSLNFMVPALLCGNAVLYKPSELATLTGLNLVDLAHRAGIPADVLQCVVGPAATGAALVACGVDLVGCGGSLSTQRAIGRAAAERRVPVQFVADAHNGAYVCDDADVVSAAGMLAAGVFNNAGQSRESISRVVVHAQIWDAFVAAFVEASKALQLGDPLDDDTNLGALTSADQAGLLATHVADAQAKGARVVLGGIPLRDGTEVTGNWATGNWFPATVLVNVDRTMALMRDHTVGPVIGLQRVERDADAIDLLRDAEGRGTVMIITQQRDRSERFLSGIAADTVVWFGGAGTSRHARVSIDKVAVMELVREKVWHSQLR